MAGIFGDDGWFNQPAYDEEEMYQGPTKGQYLAAWGSDLGDMMMKMSMAGLPGGGGAGGGGAMKALNAQRGKGMTPLQRLKMQQLQQEMDRDAAFQAAKQPQGGGQAQEPLLTPEEDAMLQQSSNTYEEYEKLKLDYLKKKGGQRMEQGTTKTVPGSQIPGGNPNKLYSIDNTGKPTVVGDIGVGRAAQQGSATPEQLSKQLGFSVDKAQADLWNNAPTRTEQAALTKRWREQNITGEKDTRDVTLKQAKEWQVVKDKNSKIIRWSERARTIRDRLSRGEEIASDDIQALYLYMKALDPDSVVRPGEVDLAKQVQSAWDSAAVAINRWTGKGDVLANPATMQLLDAVIEIGGGAKRGLGETRQQFSQRATDLGLNPEHVVGKEPEKKRAGTRRRFNPQTGELEEIK